MIKFYLHLGSPNPRKVALVLEELGLDYETVPVDIFKGEQHAADYRAMNPNGKVPAIDDDGVQVFDSKAILLHLADKHGRFLGKPEDRGELLSWLMFIATGLGPYSGQSIHFQTAGAAEGGDYAKRRYAFEAKRHYEVMDAHLVNIAARGLDRAARGGPRCGWAGSLRKRQRLVRPCQRPPRRRTRPQSKCE